MLVPYLSLNHTLLTRDEVLAYDRAMRPEEWKLYKVPSSDKSHGHRKLRQKAWM